MNSALLLYNKCHKSSKSYALRWNISESQKGKHRMGYIGESTVSIRQGFFRGPCYH